MTDPVPSNPVPSNPVPSQPSPLTATDVAGLDGLDHWTFVLGTLRADFACASFSAGSDLVAAIASAADEAGHHPDIDLRYPGTLTVALKTHAVGHVTMLDVTLAQTISNLVSAAGASPADRAVQQLEIGMDCLDGPSIRPFWQAVLDYEYIEEFDVLVDPRRQGPAIWFQQMDTPRPQRNRIHFDITVAPAEADDRLAAALAAGGVLLSDRRARAFWVLADAEGNEVCICTWQDRD